MRPPDTEQLHRLCLDRWRRLIREATKTCSLIQSMNSFPVSTELWIQAIEQRIAENEAQAQYQSARERLFEAFKPESV